MLFYNTKFNRKPKKSRWITFLRKSWNSFTKNIPVKTNETETKLEAENPTIKIVVDPPKQPPKCHSHHNFMSINNWEDTDPNTYKQRCSQLSLHKSDLILDARYLYSINF